MIFEILHWLNIDWDEEPVIQSSRLQRHIDVANDLGNLGVVVNGTDIDRLGSVDMKDKPVAGPTDMGDMIPDDIAGDVVNELGQIDLNEKSGKVASSLGNMNNTEEKGENVKSLGSLDLDDVDVADIQSLMKI